jgi:predicted permease
MTRLRVLLSRVRALVRSRELDRDIREQISSHLQETIDEYLRQGLAPPEARRAALRSFGGVATVEEAHRDARTFAWLGHLRRDVRYAVRALLRTPAFTLTALATLALVIGVNSAVFSLADTLLWRPLPYPAPDRLARVVWMASAENAGNIGTAVDGRTWEAVRDQVSTLDVAVTAGGGVGQPVNFNADGIAAFVSQARVGAGYFRVLGVAPFLGREFTTDEDRPGGAPVAVLSHGLWERAFTSDPRAIGRTMRLRGEAYEIVGVMPSDFTGPHGPVDVFTPARPSRSGEGGGTNYQVVARLRDGREWPDADGELGNIGRALLPAGQAGSVAQRRLSIRSLQQTLNDGVKQPLQLLAGAALMVLLIACVNLSALLLARGGSRRKELATRLALGCSRAALVRQLVVESLVLGAAGGAIGIGVGFVSLAALQGLGGDTFTDWGRVSLDVRVMLATGAASVVTALLFGVMPALLCTRVDVNGAMSEGGSRAVAGSAFHWGRRVLIGAEVALSVVLLVVAGLFLRTLMNLNGLEPGFDPSRVTATSVSLQDARYRSAEAVNRLFETSLAELERTPGVEAAAVSLELPYSRLLNNVFRFADLPEPDRLPLANFMYVTPGFFQTLRIPQRLGRAFTADDRGGQPPVVVVNDAFVRHLADGSNPVGRRLRLGGEEWQIVGVVGDVRTRSSGISVPGMVRGPLETPPIVFLPAAQVTDGFVQLVHQWFTPFWTVRTSGSVNVEAALRQALNRADPLLPVAPAASLASVLASATSFHRLLATLVSGFAVVALLLAAVGIYGLIAQTVLERTREFGIRLALGATFAGTIRRVMWSGVVLAGVGTAVGCGLAWVATRLVASLLWGVAAHDPLTFAGIAALLFAAALVSSVLPALGILRLDPAGILRA